MLPRHEANFSDPDAIGSTGEPSLPSGGEGGAAPPAGTDAAIVAAVWLVRVTFRGRGDVVPTNNQLADAITPALEKAWPAYGVRVVPERVDR